MNDTTATITQAILSDDQKQQLTAAYDTLTPAQQERVEDLADELMHRIFGRVAQALTSADIEKIKELDTDDTTGNVVRYFLLSKVPNLDAIIEEEMDIFKTEFTANTQG